MKKLSCYKLFLVLSLSLSSSCDKESTEIESDPKKAILGKWEIIEMRNWLNLHGLD